MRDGRRRLVSADLQAVWILHGANLEGEVLTKAPVWVLNLKWPVLITEEYMRIGCANGTRSRVEELQRRSDKGDGFTNASFGVIGKFRCSPSAKLIALNQSLKFKKENDDEVRFDTPTVSVRDC